MRQRECKESRNIASSEELTANDQSHVSSCPSCREYLTVSSAMSSLAIETAQAGSRMPSAQMVFTRARILGKRRLAAESAGPMVLFQKVAYGIIAICWLAFLMMQWTPFTQWLTGIEISANSGIRSTDSLPLNFFWMFAALSLMTMMTMIHGIWTEEHA